MRKTEFWANQVTALQSNVFRRLTSDKLNYFIRPSVWVNRTLMDINNIPHKGKKFVFGIHKFIPVVV